MDSNWSAGGLELYLADIRARPEEFSPYERRVLYSVSEKARSANSLADLMNFVFTATKEICPTDRMSFLMLEEAGMRVVSHWVRAEYEPLPHWRDLNTLWEDALARHFKVDIADYPFWLITSRSMQYSWGNNVGVQLIKEVADNVLGHGSVVMNESAAEKLGLADGDRVEVRSPLNSTRGKVVLREPHRHRRRHRGFCRGKSCCPRRRRANRCGGSCSARPGPGHCPR